MEKMYIKYHRNQKSLDSIDKTSYRLSLTGGSYRPSWLIRVSDWTAVPGSEAVNGYCTLSYCWEQSGDIVQNDDDGYDCIDNGHHCVVEKVKREAWNFFRSTVEKYVTYEELVQKVCEDFQIEYLWYDKVCIDQSDKDVKAREIKQMHNIYRNARYTIAIVPEVHIRDRNDFTKLNVYGNKARISAWNQILGSCWWKRSWTLEEVMMSKRILVIGTNTNLFQLSLHSNAIPTAVDHFSNTLLDFGGRSQIKGSINQALSEAHFRTSSKPHDIVFALTNTFAHLFDEIEIDYSIDIQTTFNDFYRHIASKDLSILCFGSNQDPDGFVRRHNTIDAYNLPSWTGVFGRHIDVPIEASNDSQLTYYIDDNMRMHITSKRYWKIPSYKYGSFYFTSFKDQNVSKTVFDHVNRVTADRRKGQWTDMATADESTIITEWLVDMKISTNCYLTHYHTSEYVPLTWIRPFSLTESSTECIILPILLKVYQQGHKRVDDIGYHWISTEYTHEYFLPVFRECPYGTGTYKAIGIYFLGNEAENSIRPQTNWNHCVGRDDIHPKQDPQTILDILFENNSYDVPEKFVIV